MSYNTKIENNYGIRVKDILVDNSIKIKNGNDWTLITSNVFHKLVSEADFAIVNDAFTDFTGQCKRYKLNVGDTLIFKCNLKYNKWYAVNFQGDMNHVLDIQVFANSTSDSVSQVLKSNLEYKMTSEIGQIQQYSDLFKVIGTGKTNSDSFNGYIIIKKVISDYSLTPIVEELPP